MSNWRRGLSAIVLTHNDAGCLPRFFETLRQAEVMEVLVCDNGSRDETVALARNSGAHVYRDEGPMAPLVNQAIDMARGTAVWFLSPRCLPPKGIADYLLYYLELKRVHGGVFRLSNRSLRGIVLNLANLLGFTLLPCGLFGRKTTIQSLGGYPEGRLPLRNLYADLCESGIIYIPDKVMHLQ